MQDTQKEIELLLRQVEQAAAKGESKKAVEIATAVIEKDSTQATAWYLRGREHFRLGKIDRSVSDFNEYIKQRPQFASRQWERGVALYYAGKFQEGAKQFELYQTYHDNDVENSVWRYLCMARAEDVETARKAMLPIKNDRRVPMMQIFELYRGKLQPQDVLDQAKSGEPPAAQLRARMFYADLYLGLWYEANGDKQNAKTHILRAAKNDQPNPSINRYMWDVARIHADRL